MNSPRQVFHALALAVAGLCGYRFGGSWVQWTVTRFPSATPVPAAIVATVAVFAAWYHGINAIDAMKWRLHGRSTWIRLVAVSAVITLAAGMTFPEAIFNAPASTGRLFSLLFCSTLCTTGAAVTISSHAKWRSDTFLRWLLSLRLVRVAAGLTAIAMVSAILLAIVEGVFYLANQRKPAGPAKVYEGNYVGAGQFFDVDPDLGTRLLPDKDVACRLKIGDQVIWDVRYGTDRHGRRATIQNASASQFAVFFGCSYLFGEGAFDTETIPSEFTKAMPEYQSYNYGVPGFGTQQMLAKLESGSIRDEINEPTGLAFYIYLPETHESRVIGEMQVYNTFADRFPCYQISSDGNLERNGSLKSGRPFVSSAYSLLGASQTVRYLGLNFPKRAEAHYKLTAKIIERSRDLCREELGCDHFFVVVYPRPIDIKILPYLDKAGIQYLDYSKLFDPRSNDMCHPIDEHPSPKANREFARQLAEDVQSKVTESHVRPSAAAVHQGGKTSAEN